MHNASDMCGAVLAVHDAWTYKFKSKDRVYNSLNDTQTVHLNAWLCESSTHTQTDIHSHPYCVWWSLFIKMSKFISEKFHDLHQYMKISN